MLVDQRLWTRLCHIVLEGLEKLGLVGSSPFAEHSRVESAGAGLSQVCREGYGDGEEEKRRLPIAPLMAGTSPARMGSNESSHGYHSAAKVHRCTGAADIHFQQDTSAGREQ